MAQIFYCPRCKEALSVNTSTYICNKCASKYYTVDGFPSFVEGHASLSSFDAAAFKSLFEMEQKHFWHVGRKELILDAIKTNITSLASIRMLEIGCGNGNVLDHLSQNKIKIEGCDLFLEGLRFCRRRSGSVPLYQINVLALPFKEEYEIIGLFDVLEHIACDDKALSEIHNALKPGGYLVLTVPAFQSLWSCHDGISHHARRYNKKELVAKLNDNGFSVRKVTYFMFFLFPLLASARIFSKIFKSENEKQISLDNSLEYKTIPIINDILLALFRIERHLIRNLDLPFGASIIAVASRE